MVFTTKTELDAMIVAAFGEKTWLKFQKPARDYILLVNFRNKKVLEKLVNTCVDQCIGKSIKLRDVQMVHDGVYRVHTKTNLKLLFKQVHPDGHVSKDVIEHILTNVYKSRESCYKYLDAIGESAYSQGKRTVQLVHLTGIPWK